MRRKQAYAIAPATPKPTPPSPSIPADPRRSPPIPADLAVVVVYKSRKSGRLGSHNCKIGGSPRGAGGRGAGARG